MLYIARHRVSSLVMERCTAVQTSTRLGVCRFLHTSRVSCAHRACLAYELVFVSAELYRGCQKLGILLDRLAAYVMLSSFVGTTDTTSHTRTVLSEAQCAIDFTFYKNVKIVVARLGIISGKKLMRETVGAGP